MTLTHLIKFFMPNDNAIKIIWIEFTNNVKTFLVPQPDDRPLDQYLAFRDKVYLLIQSPDFLNELEHAWASSADENRRNDDDIDNTLLMEIKAFSLALEVEKATETLPDNDRKKWYDKWLGRASTAVEVLKTSKKICRLSRKCHYSF